MKEVSTVREMVCGTCKYFRQHYICTSGVYRCINCGHCIHPMIKKRVSKQRCERWPPREAEE